MVEAQEQELATVVLSCWLLFPAESSKDKIKNPICQVHATMHAFITRRTQLDVAAGTKTNYVPLHNSTEKFKHQLQQLSILKWPFITVVSSIELDSGFHGNYSSLSYLLLSTYSHVPNRRHASKKLTWFIKSINLCARVKEAEFQQIGYW